MSSHDEPFRPFLSIKALFFLSFFAAGCILGFSGTVSADPGLNNHTSSADATIELINGLISGTLVRIAKELALHPIETVK